MSVIRWKGTRAGAFLLIISFAFLSAASHAAGFGTDPPAWQQVVPHDPERDTTTLANGNESTLTHEKREYTKEDGTVVKEERLVEVVKKDGKVEYTKEVTWSTEEKGDDKVKKYRSETTDSKGKKKVYETREVSKRVPGGIRTDYYTEEDGKIYHTGFGMKYDKPTDKKVVEEKAQIKPDKDGNASEKTVRSLMEDGSVRIEQFIWDAFAAGWGQPAVTMVIPEPPDIISPTTCTSGYAIGGSLEDAPEAVIAIAYIVAEAEGGAKLEIPVDGDGKWAIPPGGLASGLWKLYSVMADGRTGAANYLAVLTGAGRQPGIRVDDLPSVLFTGTSLRLPGYELSSRISSRSPDVVILSDEGCEVLEPLSYSDTEVLFSLDEVLPRGTASILVNSGDAVSRPLDTQLVSFDIIVPEAIQVGREFLVTIRITGLSGDLLKKAFTALVTISGPASFMGTDSKEILVELNNGEARLAAMAVSSGQFLISGKLVNLPEY